MTLADDVEKLLNPTERLHCCIGCGEALDSNYQELRSGARVCGDCVEDALREAGWYNDEDLHEARSEGRDEGRKEGLERAASEIEDIMDEKDCIGEVLQQRLRLWLKGPFS